MAAAPTIFPNVLRLMSDIARSCPVPVAGASGGERRPSQIGAAFAVQRLKDGMACARDFHHVAAVSRSSRGW
jgi:hypothetical protein